jgi:hypothetical protein
MYEVTGDGPSIWIGRSTNQGAQFDSRDAALRAVKRYAEEHRGHSMP